MTTRTLYRALALLLACGLAPLSLAQAATQHPGDPARWYQNDSTPQAQLRTLHKEIAAALGEAKKACHREAPARRAACLREAQDTYRQDMAHSEQLREEAHPR